jgi:hypothetical protein
MCTCCICTVANYLYWYLKVEIGDATSGQMFQAVLTCFLMQLELGDDRVVPVGSSGVSTEPNASGAGSSDGASGQVSMDTRHMLRELLSQDEYVASISK